ncbi:protoporphyrinogen/coproporphyrinogen oxidase [Kutzneria albida]|uniref:Amine oxidase domain-containing protein n=1 Tax=Kutzneria albida DSM 43870 TaxID=1449976 RepID=W5WAI1_9PSEU|nr:NAD(P)/FAD-dependent oxidoreductase [Kutzneria albida]AHH95189.1 hypothetical protein KALB_1818 [Kutzneria albida DSM 43870]
MTAEIDVAVVGAGIAGLTAAHRLRAAGRSVRVFEATDRIGGRMATIRSAGYLVDTGAEQVPERGYDTTWRLLAELGIDRSRAPRIEGGIGMWRHDRAHPDVARPRGLLTGAGLPLAARWDLFRIMALAARHRLDPHRPEATPFGSATVADLARRYHRDLGEYLFHPVVAAFFGWDPHRSAVAPFLSLLAAVGPATRWRTYVEGMDTPARALADQVDLSTSSPVRQVVADRDSARILFEHNEIRARSVLLAVPAPVALALHANPPEHELPFLQACSFTSVVKAHYLLDRRLAPRGGGRIYALLVPPVEDPTVCTVMFDHVKHPSRVPHGCGLVTLIANPAVVPELLDAPEQEIVTRLAEAGEHYVPGLREATTRAMVSRIRYGLPEATPRALGLRAGFESRLGGVVDYAGDWVKLRPSSEGAVCAGELAASRILDRTTQPGRQRV